MNFFILGCGSIGRRHLKNLRTLKPDSLIVVYEPNNEAVHIDDDWDVCHGGDWRKVIAEEDFDSAIIASPTVHHLEQMQALAFRGIPFLVEKPLCAVAQTSEAAGLVDDIESLHLKCAVGFCYRYHPAVVANLELWTRNRTFAAAAQDDLLARYGPNIGEIAAAHPIDTALRALGPARQVQLFSDGKWFRGRMTHTGGESHFDMRIDRGPRMSEIYSDDTRTPLPADDSMYVSELAAWLAWVEGGPHDGTLASLRDGLNVMHVLEQVKA